MKIQDLQKHKLPDKPGVYFFKVGKEILYIGKATSLQSRVRSYFGKDLIATRGPLLVDMVTRAGKIDFIKTDSVLEALILEANLIKKHLPKYNTKEKDNKSFNYVVITRDTLPKVLIERGRSLKQNLEGRKDIDFYGPFPNGLQLREALKIIRKIFPFIDDHSSKKQNYEFYKQLGLTPENGAKEYLKTIKNIKLFFEGKKKNVISNLKKEMMAFAKKREFEKADEVKRKIFAIEHINDVSLIKEDRENFLKYDNSSRFTRLAGSDTTQNSHISGNFRVEAYDVAHMSGKNMVGVMTVIEDGEITKSEYKKFIIRTQTDANDTGALEEVLSRRLRHTEWGLPNLIVVDGSTAQVNVAERVLNRYQFNIPVVGVVKDNRHKAKAILGEEAIMKKYKKSILLANAEAHRFAITFYRNKSRKNMLK